MNLSFLNASTCCQYQRKILYVDCGIKRKERPKKMHFYCCIKVNSYRRTSEGNRFRQGFVQGMAPPNTGLAVRLNKGHVVTKNELAPLPSDGKGGMPPMNTGLAFGLKKGHVVTKELATRPSDRKKGMTPLNTGLAIRLNKGHVIIKNELALRPSDGKGGMPPPNTRLAFGLKKGHVVTKELAPRPSDRKRGWHRRTQG